LLYLANTINIYIIIGHFYHRSLITGAGYVARDRIKLKIWDVGPANRETVKQETSNSVSPMPPKKKDGAKSKGKDAAAKSVTAGQETSDGDAQPGDLNYDVSHFC
jgi:hypothetical protein